MDMSKEQAIKVAQQEQKDKYDEGFQKLVNEALAAVGLCSQRLREAKRRLAELKYEPPEEVEL
jgi:hypothetical protein